MHPPNTKKKTVVLFHLQHCPLTFSVMAREFQNTSWCIHTNSSLCREMVSPLTPCFNSYTGGSLTMRFPMHSSGSLLHECTALFPTQVAPSPDGSVCRVHYSSNSLLHSPHRELTTLSCSNTKVCAHHFHISKRKKGWSEDAQCQRRRLKLTCLCRAVRGWRWAPLSDLAHLCFCHKRWAPPSDHTLPCFWHKCWAPPSDQACSCYKRWAPLSDYTRHPFCHKHWAPPSDHIRPRFCHKHWAPLSDHTQSHSCHKRWAPLSDHTFACFCHNHWAPPSDLFPLLSQPLPWWVRPCTRANGSLESCCNELCRQERGMWAVGVLAESSQQASENEKQHPFTIPAPPPPTPGWKTKMLRGQGCHQSNFFFRISNTIRRRK